MKTHKKPTIAQPNSLVTIDSESTRDIDDAIAVELRSEGGFRVIIAITDPLHLVKPESTEDENAKLLGATVYARDRAIRKMLPTRISEEGGSLLAGKPRKVFAFEAMLGADLELESFEIYRQTLTVTHRLSYEALPQIIKDTSHELHVPMVQAASLAHQMLAKRRTRGALALYDLARMIYTDEEGRLIQLERTEEVVGHIIVQELMVLANTLVAGYMVNHDIPAIFRNHQAKSAAPASAELAENISSWLASGALDTGKYASTFAMVMGKASYGASVLGHYALALPFYAHLTSPLRRYADLVNLRQLRAHLKGIPLPYTKEQLEDLAVFLNEKAVDRLEERSEGFKKVVREHANKAIEAGQLERLADHEMVQAIKMSAEAEKIPDQLVSELVRRFERAIVTDKIADCLFTVLPSPWPPELGQAFAKWLSKTQTVSVHLLMHAQQTEHIQNLEIQAVGQGTQFEATVTLRHGAGMLVSTKGQGSRKKDAEQQACVRAVLSMIEVEAIDLPVAAGAPQTLPGNPKGELLELCQKYSWPVPSFQSSGQGPSHAMEFSAAVTVAVNGKTFDGRANGAGSKKEAEARASADLLRKLQGIAPAQKAKSVTVDASTDNPVGALQEHCQKSGWGMPEYDFVMLRETPPLFRATVRMVNLRQDIAPAEASNKQDAKKLVAKSALMAILASTHG